MTRYICSQCGTKYSTHSAKPPASVSWEDGHKCTLVLEDDARKCHACGEPTVNKYCENSDCEVNQRDES